MSYYNGERLREKCQSTFDCQLYWVNAYKWKSHVEKNINTFEKLI